MAPTLIPDAPMKIVVLMSEQLPPGIDRKTTNATDSRSQSASWAVLVVFFLVLAVAAAYGALNTNWPIWIRVVIGALALCSLLALYGLHELARYRTWSRQRAQAALYVALAIAAAYGALNTDWSIWNRVVLGIIALWLSSIGLYILGSANLFAPFLIVLAVATAYSAFYIDWSIWTRSVIGLIALLFALLAIGLV
jgi:hypothetical protein